MTASRWAVRAWLASIAIGAAGAIALRYLDRQEGQS